MKKLNLYNLNFFDEKYFKTFSVNGYVFYPIPNKQPIRRNVYPPDYWLKLNRKMSLNSYALVRKKQENSILYKGGKYSEKRKRKFLDDLLIVVSILIGKNVVSKFYKKFNDFPLCSAKHCDMIAKNSTELQKYLETAVPQMKSIDWQNKYDNGFHIVMFYNAANVFVLEHRFLANMAIWEYLYYSDHRNKSYDYIANASLNGKIYYLVKNYILNSKRKIKQERLRIFSDLRNQLSHNGKIPIQSPKSPFKTLGFIGCKHYMELFQRLTQVLVLKTIEIDAVDKLNLFDVKQHLDELLETGFVRQFEIMDKRGIRL